MNTIDNSKGRRAALAAIDSVCFVAPFLTFVFWTDARPFTGDVSVDRGIGACLVLVLTQAGAFAARQLMHIKE
ncbi:hypothetical protein MCEMSEM23_02848 [Rhabdaerophilaceae bacterium]